MLRCTSALTFAALLLAPVIAVAQTPMMVGGPAASMLRAGTSVQLKTITELTTNGKKLKVGDRFDMEVAEPVSLNGQVVIPAGSRAVGEITAVRNNGMWGKSGIIEGRVLYVRANDKQIRMTGALNDKFIMLHADSTNSPVKSLGFPIAFLELKHRLGQPHAFAGRAMKAGASANVPSAPRCFRLHPFGPVSSQI